MSIFLELQIKLLEKDRLELREEIIKLKLDKEALKKQFSLQGVSQQREMLKAFHKWQQSMWTSPNAEITENVVDVYLKSN